ncbi:MAG: hypothetical protein ACR2H2_14090 [Solirubrobacteraceae bacterium]
MNTKSTPTAADIQAQLRLLYVERALAEVEGLAANARYMGDLLDDIQAHKSALVGAVVTDIATLRAELSGPLRG